VIHPTALVSPKAKLGERVRVGAFTIIHDNVVLGSDVTVESHCELGHPTPLAEGAPLVIGDDALIRSYSCFYEGSTFGPGLRTGHRVTVREKLRAGAGLQIGTQTDLQGHGTFGDHVRTHSNVFVAHGAKVGNFVWLLPFATLTNDPLPPSDDHVGVTVEDYAAIAAKAVILAGVTVGARSLVGAQSYVNRDVPPDTVVAGVPAKVMGPTSRLLRKDGSGRPAYPWMRHFHRGYPPEVVARWLREFPDEDT
jgi:acyl-[acyl carrier protein]--UDP-N-acetylglucosamine O-acyltransferase